MRDYYTTNEDLKIWMKLTEDEKNDFQKVLEMPEAEWDLLTNHGHFLDWGSIELSEPALLANAVYQARVPIQVYAKNTEGWNGRYNPNVPESFCKWAQGKKIRREYWADEEQYVTMDRYDFETDNFHFLSSSYEITINSYGEWLEYIEPEPEPIQRPYKDISEFPMILEFKPKGTDALIYMNYDDTDKTFWYTDVEETAVFTHEELFKAFTKRDGSIAGVEEK